MKEREGDRKTSVSYLENDDCVYIILFYFVLYGVCLRMNTFCYKWKRIEPNLQQNLCRYFNVDGDWIERKQERIVKEQTTENENIQ